MGARTPQDLDRLFAEALNARDLDGLVALYDADACLVLGGETYRGKAAIRESLASFVRMNPTILMETSTIAESGDVALTSARWKLDGTGPDGKPAHMEGRSAEVARRQQNGEWLYVLDSAFGLGQQA